MDASSLFSRAEGLKSLFSRYMAAGSAKTNPSLLLKLSADENEHVRRRVAENLSSPGQALGVLAQDEIDDVRLAVARNRHTPAHVLQQLADDVNPEVRFAIAANDLMPDAVLLGLFRDADPWVADRASQTLS